MEKQIKEALNDLSKSLRQIQGLLAWDELEKSESKPHVPPAFQIQTTTKQDLNLEIGVFINNSFAVHEALQTCSSTVREKLTKRFQQLQIGDVQVKGGQAGADGGWLPLRQLYFRFTGSFEQIFPKYFSSQAFFS
ncbi:unnamed protein product [marine sediment metagenome]|uniref:Uncharacterized protein n=1 Tax=marine sediment metagenome TaxID=412755 RepID=X0TGK3_9ZZZZ